MSNSYKIFLCTLSVVGLISQAQAMDINSGDPSRSKAVKKVNETAEIGMGAKSPSDILARFRQELVYGVKTVSLKGINFNSDMMTHLVDSLVNTYKQMPAVGIPDTPVTFLNFIATPGKTTTVEHLIFDRCTVEDLQTLYYIKGTLAPYMNQFSFPQGVRVILGTRPAESQDGRPTLDDGNRRLADTLQTVLPNALGGVALPVGLFRIEYNQ